MGRKEYEEGGEEDDINFLYYVHKNCVLNWWKSQRTLYEGWNFNFGNAAVTSDTAHLQSSYFHRPSRYSPKLCRTRSQR